jgi:hypothetical protein
MGGCYYFRHGHLFPAPAIDFELHFSQLGVAIGQGYAGNNNALDVK